MLPITLVFVQSTVISSSTLVTNPIATPLGATKGIFTTDFSTPGTINDTMIVNLETSEDGIVWLPVSTSAGGGGPSSSAAALRTPLSAFYRMTVTINGSFTVTGGIDFS